MAYEVVYDKEAVRFLDKLTLDDRQRIVKKIKEAKVNPFSYFEKLTSINAYKLIVGDYRVIADIDKTEIKILVVKIGHRKNIYKRLGI